MADEMLPVEAGGDDMRPQSRLTHLTGFVALLGGLLALAVAILVTTSVLGRWLFNAPIEGDFEFVKMATAIAVFAYLPYTQARRGNIMVDTFTTGLSQSRQHKIDAFWDFTYAAFIGFLTFALLIGTLDTLKSGETTMQRQILIWPGIGLCMLLSGLLTVSAFGSGLERLQRARDAKLDEARS
jgi:TRAP-type C4-dicarboxylate transport system permease small subunit